MNPDLSVLVLAGGDARRLGGRKADRPVTTRARLMALIENSRTSQE